MAFEALLIVSSSHSRYVFIFSLCLQTINVNEFCNIRSANFVVIYMFSQMF